jgi:hypothetical protein
VIFLGFKQCALLTQRFYEWRKSCDDLNLS